VAEAGQRIDKYISAEVPDLSRSMVQRLIKEGRVTVGGETKFACVDGPEFDAHQVDFDELLQRLAIYSGQEQQAAEAGPHPCRLEQQINETQ